MKQSMQVQRLSELSVFFNRINGTRQQFVVREHVQSLLENRDRARNPVGVWLTIRGGRGRETQHSVMRTEWVCNHTFARGNRKGKCPAAKEGEDKNVGMVLERDTPTDHVLCRSFHSIG